MRKEQLSKRWYRRWWVIILASTCAVVALIAAIQWCYEQYYQAVCKQELAQLRAELDRVEPGWRYEEMLSKVKPLPDDENAVKVMEKLAQMTKEISKITYDQKVSYKYRQLDRYLSRSGNRLLATDNNQLLNNLLVAAGDIDAHVNKILVLASGQFPIYDRNISIDNNYQLLSPLRVDAKASGIPIFYHALSLAEKGEGDKALADCRAITRLQQPFINDLHPSMAGTYFYSSVAGVLVRIFALTETTEAALQLLQADLLHASEVPLLEVRCRVVRAVFDYQMRAIDEGSIAVPAESYWQLPNRPSPGLWTTCVAKLKSFIGVSAAESITEQHLRGLRYYNQLLKILRGPTQEKMAGYQALNPRLLSISFGNDLDEQTSIRIASALVAAERFRLAQGRLPQGWHEIVPAYLPKIPQDPYDGQPMRWKQTEEGLAVYSVWVDGKDDGGKMESDEKGIQRDYGMQLWHPKFRRLPPLPPLPSTNVE